LIDLPTLPAIPVSPTVCGNANRTSRIGIKLSVYWNAHGSG